MEVFLLCINERVFLDFGKSVCVVLFNTCHLFPQTAIDLCGFLVVDRRRTSVFWMCAASCICGKCFRMDMPGVMDSFSDCGN